MSIKVAINGFGRIGRLALRQMDKAKGVEVVAVNDLTPADMLLHLFKYDTAQGRFHGTAELDGDNLVINGKKIKVLSNANPEELPWGELGVDVVLECTGFFTSKDKAEKHIKAGAKKVVISAPGGNDIKTIVYNVNHKTLDGSETVISGASCTTNCLAPMAKVLQDKFGVVEGLMTTIHAYTGDQMTLDAPHRKGDKRRARAAAANIVPNSTAEEINAAMKAAANESFGYTEEELVSSDIIGLSEGSLFDATQTRVMTVGDKQLVKTVAWYDNEMSYTNQLIRTLTYFASLIK